MPEAHEGLPVAGYQPQSQSNVDIVNQNKRLEEQVLRVLDDILTNNHDIDRRWLAIGRTHIEEGFMAVNRAIFKPQRVKLSGDRSNPAEEIPAA
jgi:hypothetical protein